jgi:hypothetical protein
MRTGVQWTETIGPKQTRRWVTDNWPAEWHVVWTVMPVTPRPGSEELDWGVAVERADADHVTYWITVHNLTNQSVTFEGRYAIMNA